MKKLVIIRLCILLLLAASCKTGSKVAQKGCTERTNEPSKERKSKRIVEQIRFDSENGRTEFHNKDKEEENGNENDASDGNTKEVHAVFRNRRKVSISITGINPQTDSVIVTCEQADVFVGGDKASDIMKDFEKTNTAEEIQKINTSGADVRSGDSTTAAEIRNLSLETLEKIRFWRLEARLLTQQGELDSLLEVMRRELFELEKKSSELHEKCQDCGTSLEKLSEQIQHVRDLVLVVEERRLNLADKTVYYQFIPLKERVDLEIRVVNKTTKALKSTSGELTFSTIGSFKMTTGIGGHVLLIDGKYARTYENIDSVIVSGHGSNIRPSLGTYLNGTWNQGWGLMGFGLGVGLPLNVSGEADLTPNFSVFMTCQFQTDYGRMGFNLGMGICKVSQLKSGYSTGQALGSASMDVPLVDLWRPGLMFGLNYVIGKQSEEQ